MSNWSEDKSEALITLIRDKYIFNQIWITFKFCSIYAGNHKCDLCCIAANYQNQRNYICMSH